MSFVPKGPSYPDANEKKRQEARNGYIQALFIAERAREWNSTARVTPELILELQRLAITQIYRCAGHFRDGPVQIQGVNHHPPDHSQVPALIEDMCAYLNDAWSEKNSIALAAYAMWRLNWIHPFYGGNGRSSRALSYLVLCARLGFALPGEPTIPELIMEDRSPYFEALRAADQALEDGGQIDTSKMESLLDSLLARQLVSIHRAAGGKDR